MTTLYEQCLSEKQQKRFKYIQKYVEKKLTGPIKSSADTDFPQLFYDTFRKPISGKRKTLKVDDSTISISPHGIGYCYYSDGNTQHFHSLESFVNMIASQPKSVEFVVKNIKPKYKPIFKKLVNLINKTIKDKDSMRDMFGKDHKDIKKHFNINNNVMTIYYDYEINLDFSNDDSYSYDLNICREDTDRISRMGDFIIADYYFKEIKEFVDYFHIEFKKKYKNQDNFMKKANKICEPILVMRSI